MVKKFLLFLIAAIIILATCKEVKSQTNPQFSISLEVADTLYFGEMVKVAAQIKINRFLPVTLHFERMISPSNTALAEKRVYLEIQHNGEVYVETLPAFLISSEVKKTKISKWHPCRVLGLFYFDSLLPVTKIDISNRKDWYKNRNKDFGEYQFRAILVNDDSDTIYSNPVRIWYLENRQ